MAGRSNGRVTFEKLQRERVRQERQAEKRARRQAKNNEPAEPADEAAADADRKKEESDMEVIMRLAQQ